MLCARFEATVSVSMILLCRKPPSDYNKDPDKDMINNMHIHSGDTCIILETKQINKQINR